MAQSMINLFVYGRETRAVFSFKLTQNKYLELYGELKWYGK